jgi:hypothetical protein
LGCGEFRGNLCLVRKVNPEIKKGIEGKRAK